VVSLRADDLSPRAKLTATDDATRDSSDGRGSVGGDTAVIQSPDSMPLQEWVRLLYAHPDDPVLWTRELKRLDDVRLRLASGGDPAGDVFTAMAISKNQQLRGIAFRHLKRYGEALDALSSSAKLLESTWTRQGCAHPKPKARCDELNDLRARTMTYVARVHTDQHDIVRADRALHDAVVLSRDASKYPHRLAGIVGDLVQQEAFARAASLVLAEIKNALDHRNEQRVSASARVASSLFNELFFWISWDRQTGKLRDGDPRDFVDNHGIGLGKSMKYGMTDPSEDQATFVTARFREEKILGPNAHRSKADLAGMAKADGFTSTEDLIKNAKLTEYVRREMADGNFEPVAKYVHSEYMDDRFYTSSGVILACREWSSPVTFAEIDRRLREAPAGTVPPSTIEILTAFERGTQFLKVHCRAKAR
jgi:hypothetical protein